MFFKIFGTNKSFRACDCHTHTHASAKETTIIATMIDLCEMHTLVSPLLIHQNTKTGLRSPCGTNQTNTVATKPYCVSISHNFDVFFCSPRFLFSRISFFFFLSIRSTFTMTISFNIEEGST